MTLTEKTIEAYLGKELSEIGGLCYKLQNYTGIPDRLVIYLGQVWFVELKASGKKPRLIQRLTINKLKSNGCNVIVIDSIEGVDNFIGMLRLKESEIDE